MNVRTIREDHKEIELKYNSEYHNIDIPELQEHRIVYNAKVRYKPKLQIDNSTLLTTSAWRN